MYIEQLRHTQGNFTLSIFDQMIAMPGKCTAVIGENGAGKSTLFRVLAGALKPNALTWSASQTQVLKILFHDAFAVLNKRLRVSDHVELSTKLHNTSAEKVESLVAEFNLGEIWSRYPPSLSAGQLTRLRLIKTLLADPDVVLLDEPTTGLQFSATESVVNCIAVLLEQHKSVVVSTHHLIELTPLQPYLIGLKNGQVVLSEEWSATYENYHNICNLMRQLGSGSRDELSLHGCSI